ncbi:MAG: ORF6N domain-containing protein [Prevotella sp.]|nr:ORF6N domain-containing protein [Prevotella sp.]
MYDIQIIRNKIYEIRGTRVMLDRDLAAMYGVETRVLNQAVKRNQQRFPEDFMFQLTKEECLRSQIVTLNTARGQHLKYLPYAFTELGVAMLSSVLRSETAIEVNMGIMRAFVSLRQLVALPDTSNRLAQIEREISRIKEEMNETLADQNDINESTRMQLDAISMALAELQADRPAEKPRKRIGFIIDDK